MRQSGGLVTALILILVLAGFGLLLWKNAEPTAPLRAIVPTQVEPTAEENSWQNVLRAGFGDSSTPFPTIAIPAQQFVPPTLAIDSAPSPTPFSASDLSSSELFTLEPTSAVSTPTLPPPSPDAQLATQQTPIAVQAAPTGVLTWQPPPLIPPLSRDPQGFDHYFFIRPVDSSATNYGLWYYPYGSDGQQESRPLRIHHGIDMANSVGETVRAAGSGTVYFASSEADPYYQNTFSYGNVVVIEHDFGWRGQPLFTLYAHLQVTLVQTGQRVEVGDPIGLTGSTGETTGPHVHFEVRLGGDRYGDTYNPTLWMVPYVGHGVIAGLLLDDRGNRLDDYDITLRNVVTTLVEATTTTYIFLNNVNDVNPDPNWRENFVFGDVPVGRYQVIATINGQRVSQVVDVFEGMTSFVELRPSAPVATAQPVTTEP